MTPRAPLIAALSLFTMLHSTRPLITLYASSLGAGVFEIGVLIAAYSALPLLFAVHAGRITDAVGNRLPALLGTVGSIVGLAVPFFSQTLAALFVSQFVFGLASMFVVLCVQNVLGRLATDETRDHNFAMFTLAASAAGVIGPICGGYLAEHLSYPLAFLVSSAIGLITGGACLLMPALRQPKAPAVRGERGGALRLLRIPALRKAMGSSALVLYSRDIFVAYFPLLATNIGLNAAQIGWVLALQAGAMMVVRFWLAQLVRTFGRDRVLFVSIVIAGGASALVPLFGSVYALALLSIAIGFGLGSGQPLSMTTTYNASPPNRTAETMGLRLAINRASLMLAPLFFGAIGAWAGLVAVFYVSGGLLLVGAFATRDPAPVASRDDAAEG